jgi:DNA (cytosine-5)-methyltransferase 1
MIKTFKKDSKKKPTYIDLFSGVGGFTVGFERLGFKNIFSLDIDNTFCKTYIKNFPNHILIKKNISQLTKKEIKNITKNEKIDVIIGGPPCQGFSIAGNIGRKFIDDPRNHLFTQFVRVVDIVKPKFFVMENVARLFTHNKGSTRREIISKFKEIGYNVECKVLNSADFGVPQIRKRVIFFGSNITKYLPFPSATVSSYLTVQDALSNLPSLKSGEKSNKFFNHVSMNHTAQMLKKMSYLSDGGNRLQIPCGLRPQSGDVRKYIRYNSKKPAVTVTGDMRKIFHYSQNRALTVRELARLQSFDDNFLFEGIVISQQQQVGNAVPPKMAEAIARKVKEIINDNS